MQCLCCYSFRFHEQVKDYHVVDGSIMEVESATRHRDTGHVGRGRHLMATRTIGILDKEGTKSWLVESVHHMHCWSSALWI